MHLESLHVEVPRASRESTASHRTTEEPFNSLANTVIGPGDPYYGSLVWPIFFILLAWTTATLGVIAWYVAYRIDETVYKPIEVGLSMACALLLAAIPPYIQDWRQRSLPVS